MTFVAVDSSLLRCLDHYSRIPLQPRELRARHRRLAERGAELRLLYREQLLASVRASLKELLQTL